VGFTPRMGSISSSMLPPLAAFCAPQSLLQHVQVFNRFLDPSLQVRDVLVPRISQHERQPRGEHHRSAPDDIAGVNDHCRTVRLSVERHAHPLKVLADQTQHVRDAREDSRLRNLFESVHRRVDHKPQRRCEILGLTKNLFDALLRHRWMVHVSGALHNRL
jgi:hypothetical protein